MIFHWNDCLYHIWTSFGLDFNLLYNVKGTSVIISELHHLRVDLNLFICVYIFLIYLVMHNSVRMIILFSIPFLSFSVKCDYLHVSLLLFL